MLRASDGSAFNVDLDSDEEEGDFEPGFESGTCILFKVELSPHIVSPGKVKWLLDLYLECDGPAAATEDGEGYSGYGITAPLEYEFLLRALDGLNVRS